MIVLNDPQGALDYVWEFVVTPSCSGSTVYPGATTAQFNTVDGAYNFASIYAKCVVEFGSASGIVWNGSQFVNTYLDMKVTGVRLRDARTTGNPAGDVYYTVDIQGFGISYIQTFRMSTITASKCMPDTITFRVEMDDAWLTGDCSQYRLRMSALRVYRDGVLIGSKGALDGTYIPDPRKLYVFMEPRTTLGFFGLGIPGEGPWRDKVIPTSGPFSLGGSQNGPNVGTNANHFATSPPYSLGGSGAYFLPVVTEFAGQLKTLHKIDRDFTYTCSIRGTWSHSGTTYPTIQYSMPSIITDGCNEECEGYPGPTFHTQRDVEVVAEYRIIDYPWGPSDVDVTGTLNTWTSSVLPGYTQTLPFTAYITHLRTKRLRRYKETSVLLVNKVSPMDRREALQIVRCAPNLGFKTVSSTIDDTSTGGSVSTGDIFVYKGYHEDVQTVAVTTPPPPAPWSSLPPQVNEATVNTCWATRPVCPPPETSGATLGVTYWNECSWDAETYSGGVRVRMYGGSNLVKTVEVPVGASVLSTALTADPLGRLTLCYVRSGNIYRTTSEDFGSNWTTSTIVRTGTMVSITTDRINSVEYLAILNGTTWELWRKKPQDSSPSFVANIITGVSSSSVGGITWVDTTESPIIFVYVTSGTRYRRISTDFGKTWANA